MTPGIDIAVVCASYVLGCFTAGYYLVKWRTGLDVRQLGSGNVGARNVGRLLGAPGFAATFLVDFAKGWVAVAAARALNVGVTFEICALLAVVIGHNWPAPLRFQGGKGIATSLGAILAWDPAVLVALALVAIPLMILLRSFSLGGLFAIGISPVVLKCCGFADPVIVGMSLLAILVLIAHRKNIRSEIIRLSQERPEKQQPVPGRFHQ